MKCSEPGDASAKARGCWNRARSLLGAAKLILAITLILAGVHPATSFAADSVADSVSEELAERVQPLVDKHAGDVAVVIKNLDGAGRFQFRQDAPMATASLIKLPLMVTAYRRIDAGELEANRLLVLTEADKVPGSGILTDHFSGGLQLPLQDAIRLMIRYSDNTATNLVAEEVGLARTAEMMASLGLQQTRMHSKVFRRDTSIDLDRSKRFGLGSTTAAEMAALLERLYRDELASDASCQAMKAHLRACDDGSKLAAGLPPGTPIAHKTGSVSSVRTDAGIVQGPRDGQAFLICVLTENNQDRRWTEDNAADKLISEIARAAYDSLYGRTLPVEEPEESAPLRLGAHGQLVEAVQRTLNERLQPSPELSIDGDFGPLTESAVISFQRSQQLDPSGVVDAATYAALGTLIERAQPVPAPDVINHQWPDKRPADPPQGVPFVTAKAWTLVDVESGERLAGDHDDVARPMASTTKLMTAMVLCELAANDPGVWDQTVTFSRQADATRGSTSGLRVGESVRAGDLLYGLLLPSGNDAAVALAEHFGDQADRLRTAFPTADFQGVDGEARFVHAMNELAQRLEMKQSHFVNPHGLTEPNHQASAADLARLTVAAFKQPRIRRVVSTPQFGVAVNGAGGYRRNVAWYNTNRLLKIEGFQGVKTGTTDAAGACLIAVETRGGQSRVVVVLGSSSSDARYADTRNLFRWGWNTHPVTGNH
ncbi:hypothetical protein FYK55_02080 [Roseiconus nitratireducens]|uniref:beta-lactamase n=1 Tax=Roseiconus nitratireducens TaxID=2605748 RepID=A0A5M6DIB1_9BACT|nr:serine hydrolase [Roseiconus nitratireducens]KAA5547213.1 hypothetical protein FYK55_02080 [Roseiconus nitratireducens]